MCFAKIKIEGFAFPLCLLISSYSCFEQLLGLVESLKGITSDYVASPCVLKLYEGGQIELFNNSDYQKLAEFSSYFLSDTDQQPACNFATFVPFIEDIPLQVSDLKLTPRINFQKPKGSEHMF